MRTTTWESRHRFLGATSPVRAEEKTSHGINRAWVHSDVIALLATKAIDPLQKMDGMRPSPHNSKYLEAVTNCVTKCQAILSGKQAPQSTVQPSHDSREADAEEEKYSGPSR